MPFIVGSSAIGAFAQWEFHKQQQVTQFLTESSNLVLVAESQTRQEQQQKAFFDYYYSHELSPIYLILEQWNLLNILIDF